MVDVRTLSKVHHTMENGEIHGRDAFCFLLIVAGLVCYLGPVNPEIGSIVSAICACLLAVVTFWLNARFLAFERLIRTSSFVFIFGAATIHFLLAASVSGVILGYCIAWYVCCLIIIFYDVQRTVVLKYSGFLGMVGFQAMCIVNLMGLFGVINIPNSLKTSSYCFKVSKDDTSNTRESCCVIQNLGEPDSYFYSDSLYGHMGVGCTWFVSSYEIANLRATLLFCFQHTLTPFIRTLAQMMKGVKASLIYLLIISPLVRDDLLEGVIFAVLSGGGRGNVVVRNRRNYPTRPNKVANDAGGGAPGSPKDSGTKEEVKGTSPEDILAKHAVTSHQSDAVKAVGANPLASVPGSGIHGPGPLPEPPKEDKSFMGKYRGYMAGTCALLGVICSGLPAFLRWDCRDSTVVTLNVLQTIFAILGIGILTINNINRKIMKTILSPTYGRIGWDMIMLLVYVVIRLWEVSTRRAIPEGCFDDDEKNCLNQRFERNLNRSVTSPPDTSPAYYVYDPLGKVVAAEELPYCEYQDINGLVCLVISWLAIMFLDCLKKTYIWTKKACGIFFILAMSYKYFEYSTDVYRWCALDEKADQSLNVMISNNKHDAYCRMNGHKRSGVSSDDVFRVELNYLSLASSVFCNLLFCWLMSTFTVWFDKYGTGIAYAAKAIKRAEEVDHDDEDGVAEKIAGPVRIATMKDMSIAEIFCTIAL